MAVWSAGCFPTGKRWANSRRATEYSEIQLMLARLRQRSNTRGDGQEPTRVITVRLPQSLHEALQAEAYAHETSMNKLCITKLLQVIDGELTEVPATHPGATREPTNP